MGVGEAWWRTKTDPDVRKIRAIMSALVLWLVLGIQSCDQVRYAVWGGRATATVVERIGFDRHGRRERLVKIQWHEAGNPTVQRATVEVTEQEFGGYVPDRFEVVYLPGKPSYTVPAHRRSWLWPGLFVGSIVVGVGAFVLIGRSITAHERKPAARKVAAARPSGVQWR